MRFKVVKSKWAVSSKNMTEYMPYNVEVNKNKKLITLLQDDVFSSYLVIFAATLSPPFVRVGHNYNYDGEFEFDPFPQKAAYIAADTS